MTPDIVRRVVEALLPWYDRAEQDRRVAHTESIRQRSITARRSAEVAIAGIDQIRDAYRSTGQRFERR